MNEETAYVIISYVPMLENPVEPGKTFDIQASGKIEEITSLCDQADGTINGVLWFGNEEAQHPVFAIENAAGVAKHLIGWAEGEVEDWFEFRYFDNGERYCMALSPRVDKSIERFRMGVELHTGEPPNPQSEFNVLFKPLIYISSESNTIFEKIKKIFSKQDKVGLGLIDITNVAPKWGTVDSGLIIPIGLFPLNGPDESLKSWMEE